MASCLARGKILRCTSAGAAAQPPAGARVLAAVPRERRPLQADAAVASVTHSPHVSHSDTVYHFCCEQSYVVTWRCEYPKCFPFAFRIFLTSPALQIRHFLVFKGWCEHPIHTLIQVIQAHIRFYGVGPQAHQKAGGWALTAAGPPASTYSPVRGAAAH